MTDAAGASVEGALRKKFPQIDNKAIAATREIVEETFSVLKPGIVRLVGGFMVRNFTEGELKDLIAFYKTSTGQKALSLMPKMTQETMAWLLPEMQNLQSTMQKKLQERLKGLGYDL